MPIGKRNGDPFWVTPVFLIEIIVQTPRLQVQILDLISVVHVSVGL